jgi:obg-like ATPase 1
VPFLILLRLQVVRCFEDENVVHVSGKVDPLDDTDVINFELVLADVAQVEKRLERLKKGRAKSTEEKAKEAAEKAALEQIQTSLEDGKPARSAGLSPDDKEAVQHLQLLTLKPLIYAANVSEDELSEPDSNEHVQVCLMRVTICSHGRLHSASKATTYV